MKMCEESNVKSLGDSSKKFRNLKELNGFMEEIKKESKNVI